MYAVQVYFCFVSFRFVLHKENRRQGRIQQLNYMESKTTFPFFLTTVSTLFVQLVNLKRYPNCQYCLLMTPLSRPTFLSFSSVKLVAFIYLLKIFQNVHRSRTIGCV